MNMRGAMPLPSKMIMMRNHPGLGPGPVPGPGRDVLQGNPDFEIPGMRPPGRVGPGNGGMMGAGGGASMQQPGGGGPMNGLTGVGRYPPP